MFNIGDEVIRNKGIWANQDEYLKGIVGGFKADGNFYLKDENPNAGRHAQYWSLIEPIAHHLTPFVFIEEGMDYIKVGTGDYASLEDAHKRCLELRRIHKSDKIYSYVRVEE